MHLAEKFGAFLPTEPTARAETLSWLFWQMGSAPFLGGGFGHFYAYAPTKLEYPINRYAMAVKRQIDVLDRRLAYNQFVAGNDYTIADMAIRSEERTSELQSLMRSSYDGFRSHQNNTQQLQLPR